MPGIKKLWRCPKCLRTFANRNQSHFCGSQRSLQAHFRGKPKAVKHLFQQLRAAVLRCGPVTILSEKPGSLSMSACHLLPFRSKKAGCAAISYLQDDSRIPASSGSTHFRRETMCIVFGSLLRKQSTLNSLAGFVRLTRLDNNAICTLERWQSEILDNKLIEDLANTFARIYAQHPVHLQILI